MIDLIETPVGKFREVARPPVPIEDRWIWQCPGCGVWGYLDDDQWHGRVSVDHAGMEDKPMPCSYHETHNFYAILTDAMRTDV